jgi:hypothetical protein
VTVERTTLRGMVELLRQLEGWRVFLRVPLAWGLWLLGPAVVIGGAAVAALFAIKGHVLATVISTAASTALAWLAAVLRKRFPWRSPVANRLATYTEPNPRTYVAVLLGSGDVDHAVRALRRAKFNPTSFLRIGSRPPDALDLDYQIGVEEPAAHRQSTSDDDRNARLRAVFEKDGLQARVGSVDVFARSDARPLRIPTTPRN